LPLTKSLPRLIPSSAACLAIGSSCSRSIIVLRSPTSPPLRRPQSDGGR
jgi:hypothetical protein